MFEKEIKQRIDRFNRLFKEATGHTFEEDEQWCKEQNEKERPTWEAAMNAVLTLNGFTNHEEYIDKVHNKEIEPIDEIKAVFLKQPCHSSNFSYEMFVINEAKALAEFILTNLGKDWWQNAAKNHNYNDMVKLLNVAGYVTNPEHSYNSFGAMMTFVGTLLNYPENFQYLHGALAPLVGDAGYHDDRSDLPE